jgi:hypothetical protein
MKKIFELTNEEAKAHFLKGSSYFNLAMPPYISFEPILTDVEAVLNKGDYSAYSSKKPNDLSDVNYNFLTNKDGKLAWRPLELIHPAIYVSLVNLICDPENWEFIKERLSEFQPGVVTCCSAPVMSLDDYSYVETQIKNWWQKVEQQSLIYSLDFSHILQTDVIDCYGSFYTHSITWALHGLEKSKKYKGKNCLLGDKIDSYIRAGRFGQTNGISQGSSLMDFIAEIVLGFVDELINSELKEQSGFRILRYRDDYRIFTNSDDRAESILKVISEKLQIIGMKLGVTKTLLSRNVIEGSIKPDKLAGIELRDEKDTSANTIQKKLLRLHSFGQRYPNSGALRRLLQEFYTSINRINERPDDLEVQVAIVTDIGFISPVTIPVVAGILSHMISLASPDEMVSIWDRVWKKMARVPHNGYLDIWLQRVTQSKGVDIKFESSEPICKIVNGETLDIWNNSWISSQSLRDALSVSKIKVGSVSEIDPIVQPEEIALFTKSALEY